MNSNTKEEPTIKKKLKDFRNKPLLYGKQEKEASSILNDYKQQQMALISQNRWWMHVIIKNFHSTCEIKRKKSLNNTKFVIDMNKTVYDYNHNNQFVKGEIYKGMPISEVQQLFSKNECKILPFCSKCYTTHSTKILEMLKVYDKETEKLNLNEFLLDITEYCKSNNINTEDELGKVIKNVILEVYQQLSFDSYATIANNKILVKLATKVLKQINEKKRQISETKGEESEELRSMLISNNIDKINFLLYKFDLVLLKNDFIFEKTLNDLLELNIKTLGEISENFTEIYHLFPHTYKNLISLALGIGDNEHESIYIEPISISAEVEKHVKLLNEENMIELIKDLANDIGEDCEKNNYMAETLSIIILDSQNRKYCKTLSIGKKFETKNEIVGNSKNLLTQLLETYPMMIPKEIQIRLSKIHKFKKEGILDKKINANAIEKFVGVDKINHSAKYSTNKKSKSKQNLERSSSVKALPSAKKTPTIGREKVTKRRNKTKNVKPMGMNIKMMENFAYIKPQK